MFSVHIVVFIIPLFNFRLAKLQYRPNFYEHDTPIDIELLFYYRIMENSIVSIHVEMFAFFILLYQSKTKI